MYGRGAKSIAEQLGIETREAKQIIESFYKFFPKIKIWVEDVVNKAKEDGYVTTLWGRRRYIPEITKQPYEFKLDKGVPQNFNPLDFSQVITNFEVDDVTKQKLTQALDKAWKYMDKQKIMMDAKNNGITIVNNGGFISSGEREAKNTKIQGSAADMTKRAMLFVHNNVRLKELNFRMLIPVHDEIIGECPIQNAVECGRLLKQLMIQASDEMCSVSMKCDATYSYVWSEALSMSEKEFINSILQK